MKAIVVITDSDAIPAFERAFLESGNRGFTVVPSLLGRGRSGLKTGDRVHPGGSSLLFTVVRDEEGETVLAFLRGVRDRAGVRDQTKIYLTDVEEAD
jgi:nitrogen regulatory protein PII